MSYSLECPRVWELRKKKQRGPIDEAVVASAS
jgi:hypothetical protein